MFEPHIVMFCVYLDANILLFRGYLLLFRGYLLVFIYSLRFELYVDVFKLLNKDCFLLLSLFYSLEKGYQFFAGIE